MLGLIAVVVVSVAVVVLEVSLPKWPSSRGKTFHPTLSPEGSYDMRVNMIGDRVRVVRAKLSMIARVAYGKKQEARGKFDGTAVDLPC